MPARPPFASATARAVRRGAHVERDGTVKRPRSLSLSARGTARGALVRSSKNGVGRPSPRTHQPSSFDARRAKSPTDGGGGAFGGSAPIAERSKIRQSGGPSTSFRDLPPAAWSMKQCTSPMTGKPRGRVGNRRPATFAVPAQDLAERHRHRSASRARCESYARGRQLEDVGPTGVVEHIRPIEEARECLAIPAIADEAEAGGWRDVAGKAAHPAALASKRKVQRHAWLTSRRRSSPFGPGHAAACLIGAGGRNRKRTARSARQRDGANQQTRVRAD
jgi:hypothetical protein